MKLQALISTTCVVALVALSRPASAHFYIDKLNGGTGALRPIVGNMNSANFPIQGNDIINDNVICNAAKPFDAYAPSPLTVAAGDTLVAHWTNGPTDTTPIGAAHYGVCHVHIGKGLKPAGWTKIYETTPDSAGDWCLTIIGNNDNNYEFKIPAELAPGQYVIRIQLPALHAAGQPGGAQFYIRCFDIIVTGSGTAVPPYEVKIPGNWNLNTPGVLFDLYAGGKNAADGASYKGVYPEWGGDLWVPKSSAPVATLPSPVVVAPAVPSSQATSNNTPVTGECKAKLNQCGGSAYTGVTQCCAGSTCTVKSAYYSQCT